MKFFKQHAGYVSGFGRVLFVIVLCIITACSNEGDQQAAVPLEKRPESFRFFELGVNTVFTSAIREGLRETLGSDAIAYQTPIDLDINYKGFLAAYFPQLHALDRRLNLESGVRVEHQTRELMYRRAQRKNLPFEYVKLLFSNHSQTPLLFEIKASSEGGYILDTLKDQYGPPKTVDWQGANAKGRSLYWEKHADVLIVSVTTNIYGNPEYHVMMYYVGNLEALLEIEKKGALAREKESQKAGKKAF